MTANKNISASELKVFEDTYCQTKGIEAKWDQHTKKGQLTFSFNKINERGPGIVKDIKITSRTEEKSKQNLSKTFI